MNSKNAIKKIKTKFAVLSIQPIGLMKKVLDANDK
jgi:hypothetical protein